jgi:hypothetical protein
LSLLPTEKLFEAAAKQVRASFVEGVPDLPELAVWLSIIEVGAPQGRVVAVS